MSAEVRQQICEEASTWLDTPFFDKQGTKKLGCDCATFLYKVFVPRFTLGPALPDYHIQFFLHRNDELYTDMVLNCGLHEVPKPSGPGDVFVVKLGRVFAHGGIILNWPEVIFANPRIRPPRVIRNIYHDNSMFAGREVKFFSLFSE